MTSLSRAEVRAVDATAISEFLLPGIVLMENAGRGAADWLCELGIAGPVVVCAGRGNNGGDGFVIARHLELRGVAVEIVFCGDPQGLQGDAAINHQVVLRSGIPLRYWSGEAAADLADLFHRADWIVDALLGTGAVGPAREPIAGLIGSINRSGRRVFAVDLPSGLDCDTGVPVGACIRASATATFVAPKRGFDLPGAADWTGQVRVIDIGIPRRLRDRVLRPDQSPADQP